MKLFWKKFSAVALIGAMLSNVGCTYKADIEELNRQVEALKGTVALKADVQKIQTTVEQIAGVDFSQFLKTADFAAQLKASGVAYSSDLKAWLTSDEVKALIEGYQYQTAEDVLKLIAGFMTQEDVEKMIEGLQSKEDVEKMIKDLMSKEDVEKMIEGLQSKEGVEAIFDAMIKAYDIWGAVSGDVAVAIADAMKNAEFMTGESKLSDAQVNQVMSEIAKAFGAEGADVKAAIDGWLGENFAKYMEAYEPTEAFIAKLGIGSSAVSAILDEVGKENSDLVKAINKLITEATDGAVTEDTLKETFNSYKEGLEALTNRVAELEGRIQSIVWVPQTTTEAMSHTVMLGARNTITLKPTAEEKKANKDAEDKVVVLSNSEKTVVWQVAPKSALTKIDDPATQIEVYSSKVATKAEERPTWKTTAVKIDPEKGTVAVTISAEDDLYREYDKDGKEVEYTGDKDVIALHISVPSKAEGSIGGIDYTSDYILVDQVKGVNYPSNEEPFVFSKGKFNEAFGTATINAEYNQLYTKTGAVTFVEDAAVTVEDGKDAKGNPVYTSIEEKWPAAFESGDIRIIKTYKTDKDGKEELAEVTPKLNEDDKDLLELTSRGFTVKKSGSALVDKTVTSKEITYTITDKDGKYELELGKVQVKYTFTKEKTEAVASPANFDWKYKKVSYTTAGAKNRLEVDDLAAAVFNTIPKKEASVLKTGYLKDNSTEEEVAGVKDVIIVRESTPSVDSDVMYVDLAIDVNSDTVFVKGGAYTAVFEFNTNDTDITLNIPVTFTAAPELKAPTAYTKDFKYNGEPDFELVSAKADFKNQLIELNKDLWDAKSGEGTHINKSDFVDMVNHGVLNTEKDGKAVLSVADKALNVTFDINDKDFVYGKVYTPYIKYGIKGFGFKVETKVSLVKPTVELVANPALVGANGALVKSNINLDTKKLEVEKKDFVHVFDVKIDGKVNNTDYVVSYSIVKEYKKDKDGNYILDKGNKIPADDQTKALDSLGDDAPVFDGNVLDWKEWDKKELKLMATARHIKDEKMFVTETFTAYINNPVANTIKVIEEDKKEKWNTDIYAGGEVDLTRHFELQTSSVIAGTNKTLDVIATTEDAKNANAAIKGNFTFAFVGNANSLVELDSENSMIRVTATPVEITEDFKVTVKVTYENKFMAKGEDRTAEITFTVKKGTK